MLFLSGLATLPHDRGRLKDAQMSYAIVTHQRSPSDDSSLDTKESYAQILTLGTLLL